MSWLGRFQWTEGIKNTACRYLLQRYLGQFLEEKLTLDQLTVNLCNGTGSVTNVKLDVQVFGIFSLFHRQRPAELITLCSIDFMHACFETNSITRHFSSGFGSDILIQNGFFIKTSN